MPTSTAKLGRQTQEFAIVIAHLRATAQLGGARFIHLSPRRLPITHIARAERESPNVNIMNGSVEPRHSDIGRLGATWVEYAPPDGISPEISGFLVKLTSGVAAASDLIEASPDGCPTPPRPPTTHCQASERKKKIFRHAKLLDSADIEPIAALRDRRAADAERGSGREVRTDDRQWAERLSGRQERAYEHLLDDVEAIERLAEDG